MLTQEDVKIPELPELVLFLHDLQLGQYSVELNRESQVLFVWPTPPEELAYTVSKYYEELMFLQPGVCDNCQRWQIRRFDAYWGASPLYCPACLTRIIAHFNKTGTWPEVQIDEP